MAHIWSEGTSHRYTSPSTKLKVICKDQDQISGSRFSKDGCFGGISVSQTHLVLGLSSCPLCKIHFVDYSNNLIW